MSAISKYFLSLFFALIGVLEAIGQPPPSPVSYPFPKIKAVWSELVDKYGMLGDTVIDNKQYKKVYTSQDSVFNFSNASYYAAIREFPDGIIKTIVNGETQERQLYNFTLLEGSSTTVWSKDYGDVEVTFLGVDSINVVYEQRYVFKYSVQGSSNQFEWIEGIGSTKGLFYPAFTPTVDPSRNLICFSENDSLKYQNSLFSNCKGDLVNIKENSSSLLSIYPNPTETTLYIESPINLENTEFELRDLLGKIVHQIQLGNGYRFEIHDLKLGSGVYAYRISSNGVSVKSGKLIVRQ